MSLAARRKRDAAAFKRAADDAPEVIDATQIREPRNCDEALALFALYATEGDVISLHGDMCLTHLSADNACSCTPVELRIGARA